MSKPSVVVIGDVVLDRDVSGTAERLSPDAPVPVVEVDDVRERPGGAGLAAQLCASGSVDVTLVAPVASDAAGRRLGAMLSSDLNVVALPHEGPTRHKTRVLAGGQAVVRLDGGGPGAPVDPALGEVREVLRDADVVLVSDYGAGTTHHGAIRELLATVARRVPTVWDPHPRGGEPVAGVIATPNLAEAKAAATRSGLDADGDGGSIALELAEHWRACAVCVTAGPDGAHLGLPPDEAVHHPAPWEATGDTCGAGDRLVSAIVRAIAFGAAIGEAVAAGVGEATAWVAAGGVSARVERPAPPRPDPPAYTGLTSASPEFDGVAAARARGGVVVATGGCFDILHAGHVACLEAARRMGDALVVLINSDASVRRRKGPGRPVVTASERARILRALRCVDAVEIFDEDDPRVALDRLRPDIWVKGGDYAGRTLREGEIVESWGGRVVVGPYLDGYSTTSLLRRSIPTRMRSLTEVSWTR